MTTTMSSREFNQETGRAKKAAEHGPVYITERGRPRHVLMSYDDYERLVGQHVIIDLLSQPDGVAHVEFVAPRSRERAEPAAFD